MAPRAESDATPPCFAGSPGPQQPLHDLRLPISRTSACHHNHVVFINTERSWRANSSGAAAYGVRAVLQPSPCDPPAATPPLPVKCLCTPKPNSLPFFLGHGDKLSPKIIDLRLKVGKVCAVLPPEAPVSRNAASKRGLGMTVGCVTNGILQIWPETHVTESALRVTNQKICTVHGGALWALVGGCERCSQDFQSGFVNYCTQCWRSIQICSGNIWNGGMPALVPCD